MSTLRVTNLKGGSAGSAPNLPDGAVISGVITATSFKGSGNDLTGSPTFTSLNATTGTFSGNVSIGGTLTYEDVTNIDSVGIVTARQGIKVTAGGVDVTAGGVSVTAGGIDVTAGGVSVTAGGINVTAGGINVSGIVTASNGVEVTGNYTENITAVSGTAVDCSTASYFTKTITGATTFTFTNVPTGVAYAFTFEVTLNGSNAITWPASVKWPADTAPTITDGKTQVFVFLTDDGGTRWRGSSLVDYTN
tara:strand:+ start:181 stop:927 length:747 start_codon:yes stop_codon:yes gene_type:complete